MASSPLSTVTKPVVVPGVGFGPDDHRPHERVLPGIRCRRSGGFLDGFGLHFGGEPLHRDRVDRRRHVSAHACERQLGLRIGLGVGHRERIARQTGRSGHDGQMFGYGRRRHIGHLVVVVLATSRDTGREQQIKQ